jgi:hypothetical protein
LVAAGWPPRLAALVAHHSGARFPAALLALDETLAAYACEDGPLADADQTTGPHGEPMDIDTRMRERAARHGPDSPSADGRRGRHIRDAAARVELRMARRNSPRPPPGNSSAVSPDGCRCR